MPSGPLTKSPKPNDLTFFLDRGLGKHTIATAIRHQDSAVVCMGDVFPDDGQGTSDPEWIEAAPLFNRSRRSHQQGHTQKFTKAPMSWVVTAIHRNGMYVSPAHDSLASAGDAYSGRTHVWKSFSSNLRVAAFSVTARCTSSSKPFSAVDSTSIVI